MESIRCPQCGSATVFVTVGNSIECYECHTKSTKFGNKYELTTRHNQPAYYDDRGKDPSLDVIENSEDGE